MEEEKILRRRKDWQIRYDKRRVLVFILEIIANLFWIAFGILLVSELSILLMLIYFLCFVFLFLPGLGFVVYDYYKTRNMKLIDRLPDLDAEKENPEFTKTIMKSTQFLTCFLGLILIPAFLLLEFLEAFLWASFFSAVFILVIATLSGACWRINTSCVEEEK